MSYREQARNQREELPFSAPIRDVRGNLVLAVQGLSV
jgi:hypothetical protein